MDSRAVDILKQIEATDEYKSYLEIIKDWKEVEEYGIKCIDYVGTDTKINGASKYSMQKEHEFKESIKNMFISIPITIDGVEKKMEFINDGGFRAVFKIDDMAIKVATSMNSSNRNEVRLIEHLNVKNKELLSYICPILAYNDNIVIAKLCDVCTSYGKEESEIMDKFLYNHIFFSELAVEDISKDLGLLDGQLVIIDYADWEIISDEELQDAL